MKAVQKCSKWFKAVHTPLGSSLLIYTTILSLRKALLRRTERPEPEDPESSQTLYIHRENAVFHSLRACPLNLGLFERLTPNVSNLSSKFEA